MPRSPLHPFPKSLVHPNSMNKLPLTSQQQEMHSSRMHTTLGSSRLLGGVCLRACWDTPSPPPRLGPGHPPPSLGLDIPVWAWIPPRVGLDPPGQTPNLPTGSGPRHRSPATPPGPGPRHPSPVDRILDTRL